MSINFKNSVLESGILAFLLVLLVMQSASAEMRVWADRYGNEYAAEYVRELFGKVYLRDAADQLITVDVQDLSASAIRYLRTMIPPKVKMHVSRKTEDLETSEYVFQEDVSLVTLTIQTTKTSPPAFEGRLAGELYLIGKEIVTGRYVILGRERFHPVFNEENEGRHTVVVSKEVRQYVDVNRERRGFEFEGYLIILTGPQGNRIETETNLSRFSDEALESIRYFPVFTFFNQDGRKLSVPRPAWTDDRWSGFGS